MENRGMLKVCELPIAYNVVEHEIKAERGSDERHNAASSSSSSSSLCSSINLNEPPLGFETNSASSSSPILRRCNDFNEPPLAFEKNETNGASSRQINNFDLNEVPAEFDTEEPHSPSLLGNHDIPQNPPSPNPESSSSGDKKRKSADKPKKANKKKQEPVLEAPPPTPEWLLNLEETEDVKFIFKKALIESDLKTAQSRLLIPFSKVYGKNDFLTAEEKFGIEQDKGENGRKHGIKTTILMIGNPKKWDLRLVLWLMKKKESDDKGTWNYALNSGWNKFVAEQNLLETKKLEVNEVISLWSFRSQGTLCFAIDV